MRASIRPIHVATYAVVALLASAPPIVASAEPIVAPTRPHVPAARTYDADVFTYSHGWERVALNDGRFHDTSMRSFRPGARATLEFEGTAFDLYGVIGPRGGLGLVSVDGHAAYISDFYGPTKLPHLVVYRSPPLRRGSHRVTVEILRERASPGRYVNLDGITVR